MKDSSHIVLKLKEVDFFLEKMKSCDRAVNELNFYFSAFISAARSVTFVIQYVGKNVSNFDSWYSEEQRNLSGDKIAKFLLEARNDSQKKGAYPITRGKVFKPVDGSEVLVNYFSYIGTEEPYEIPDGDVLNTCSVHMRNLTGLVARFFQSFENEIWNVESARAQLLAGLEEARPFIDTPDPLWVQTISHIKSNEFVPQKPSHGLSDLVEKYA